MIVINAPDPVCQSIPCIFLAGSIDAPSPGCWRKKVIADLSDQVVCILNPQRPDWDEGLQRFVDGSTNNHQVAWEYAAMKQARFIVMNFLPGKLSPVSLLELGLNAAGGRLLVCCPVEYEKSAYVYFVCKQFNVPLFNNLTSLVHRLKAII